MQNVGNLKQDLFFFYVVKTLNRSSKFFVNWSGMLAMLTKRLCSNSFNSGVSEIRLFFKNMALKISALQK